LWAKTLQDYAIYFQKIMPMVLENLVIAWHRDSLRMGHTNHNYNDYKWVTMCTSNVKYQ
jgi:hypothetical protein